MGKGICCAEGCDKPAKATGRCSGHYERRRLTGVDGGPLRLLSPRVGHCAKCDRPISARGLCKQHYGQKQFADNRDHARAVMAVYRARPEIRERIRQRARSWGLANPERKVENERRRRALKLSTVVADISPELLASKLAYWGNRCWIGGPRCTVEPEHWDHVKPLTRGGLHVLANLRPACLPCNLAKYNHWPFPTARRSLSA